MTGEWPSGVIDHKDLNKANNKWTNLRDVTESINSRNAPLHKLNVSGVSGVSWDSVNKKWHTSIHVDGKMLWLGRFISLEDAISTRMAAEKEHWGEEDRVWDQL
jgi:hypothetical protein